MSLFRSYLSLPSTSPVTRSPARARLRAGAWPDRAGARATGARRREESEEREEREESEAVTGCHTTFDDDPHVRCGVKTRF